jgi:hypothetical protein
MVRSYLNPSGFSTEKRANEGGEVLAQVQPRMINVLNYMEFACDKRIHKEIACTILTSQLCWLCGQKKLIRARQTSVFEEYLRPFFRLSLYQPVNLMTAIKKGIS